MSNLFYHFVKQYTSFTQKPNFRRFYENSWLGIDKSKEVSAIRDYLLKPNVGVDYLNKHVASAISNSDFDVKFCSVFCHQKPRVTRTKESIKNNAGSTNSCELGDLFILFVLLDKNDKMHYCAGSLFQAKVKSKLDSESQRALYDDDLDFLVPHFLEKRITPNSKYRKMPTYNEGRAKALRYLILEPAFSPEHVQARYSPWSNDYQLRASTFLDGLLSGSDGLKADPINNPHGSWEIIVSDLLHTALTVTARKPARGNTDAVKVATSHFNNFRNLDAYSVVTEDKEKYGVPTLMVIAQSKENFDT
ncbi:hypothetical protein K3H43_06490 [Aeromonas veronii]|uniref:hypothetical protein n=1 Tax=Aeromonas veronii TaxID=654 RepID=UPI001F3D86E1|nr:hypothetical protein [Aeromonas veronii]MCF5727027.1 hypothetical protein [Aeromonas veronii]